jgi:hypothetical protein
MGSILQEIQLVHSLRKNIRDPKLSSTILASIESIQRCLKTGIDQNGWKTVEWRGSRAPQSHAAQKSYSYGSRGQNAHNGHNGHNNRETAPSNAAFSQRTRAPEPVPSISTSIPASIPTSTPTSTPASIPLTTIHPPVSQKGNGAWHDSSDGFRPHQKYISKFKKTAGKVEDTILNTILLGKLNKFSQPNYNEIKEFITHIIASGQTDMMKCFMKLVFEKAASEEVFCPLYARLLSELSADYPVLLTEMANLYSQYMEIFEEVPEHQTETYQEMCKRNVEKKYRRGYSQFLAELIKHNVVDQETFMKIITTIIRQVEVNLTNNESTKLIEELADCFMKIVKAIRVQDRSADIEEDTLHAIRQILKNEFSERIEPFTISQSGLSNKARFTFLDIYESIQL